MKLFLLSLFSFLLVSSVTQAQTALDHKKSQTSLDHAQNYARTCINGRWGTKSCMDVMANSNSQLAINFIIALKKRGQEAAVKQIQETCAAATAVGKQTVPVHAVSEAFTVCANKISDISDMTGIQPDTSHYQLLITSVFCLRNNPRCLGMEKQLARYK